MGWASGGELMDEVIRAVKKDVPDKARARLYRKLIRAFRDMDWDTEHESLGIDPVFDRVLKAEDKRNGWGGDE